VAAGAWRRIALSALAGLLLATSAHAQSAVDRDVGTDLRKDRQTLAPTAAEAAAAGQGFRLELTAPVLYTSNAVRESTDTLVTRKGDWHFNPDLLLRWSHQYSFVKLSAAGDVSVDRYFTQTSADEDTLYGYVKAALTDGRSDLFVPYALYAGTVDFNPTFASWLDTLHDLALGVTSGAGFRNGRRILLADAVEPGDASIAVDLRAGRRLSHPRDFENTFVTLAVDASYVYDKTWTFTLSPKFRMRWYDSFEGSFRRDYRPSVILQATWTPDWLTRWVRRAEIDFTVTFLRNFSNLAEERFSEWDVGPSLTFAWKF
jgi:hypothetical protein